MSKQSQLVGKVFYGRNVSMLDGCLLTGIEAALFIAVDLESGCTKTYTARDLAGFTWTTVSAVKAECESIIKSVHREDSPLRQKAESVLFYLTKLNGGSRVS
jgi:hypothetical protein